MKKQAEKPASITSEKPVYNSNMYLQMRKSFNILQKRIIHFVVRQLQAELFKLNDEKFKGKPIERTLFGDCYFHIPYKTIDPLNQDTEIRRALKGLQIPIDDRNFIGNFMLSAERKDGEWRLLFPEKAVHFLTEVSKGVTPLGTLVYMSADSIYTVRMYELLMQFRDTGRFNKTPEELCELVGAPDRYKRDFSALRKRVLEVAKKELKALYNARQSEIYFTWTEERGGRGGKVKKLNFSIFSFTKEIKSLTDEAKDLDYISTQLMRIMVDEVDKGYRKGNEEFVKRALSRLVEQKQLKRFAEKLEKILNDGKIPFNEKGRVLRFVLGDQFNVE